MMTNLLGTAVASTALNDAKRQYANDFFSLLGVADQQRKRKEGLNSYGQFFASLLGDGTESKGSARRGAQVPQVQLPGIPRQQRRQRAPMANPMAKMFESLLMGGM